MYPRIKYYNLFSTHSQSVSQIIQYQPFKCCVSVCVCMCVCVFKLENIDLESGTLPWNTNCSLLCISNHKYNNNFRCNMFKINVKLFLQIHFPVTDFYLGECQFFTFYCLNPKILVSSLPLIFFWKPPSIQKLLLALPSNLYIKSDHFSWLTAWLLRPKQHHVLSGLLQ